MNLDKMNLWVLNREERRTFLSRLRNLPQGEKKTMLVKLNVPVVAKGSDGGVIEMKQGAGAPLLKQILLHALREVHFEVDKNQGAKEKTDRYLLDKRIAPEDYSEGAVPSNEIELTEGELKMLRERVGRLFLNANFVGRTCELLDPTVLPVTEAVAPLKKAKRRSPTKKPTPPQIPVAPEVKPTPEKK